MRTTVLCSLVLLLLQAACDSGSGSEERPDSEVIVGNWRITAIEDATGDLSVLIGSLFTELRVRFGADGGYHQEVETPQQTAVITGTWNLNESSGTVSMTVFILAVGDDPLAWSYQYAFDGDNRVRLTGSAATTALLVELLGLPFSHPLSVTLTRR